MTDDFIRREAAREKLCSMCRWEGTENCGECEHPIDDIPAADVVEVVRCRECKHWQESETSKEYGSCDIDALLRWGDFFCEAGDMREVQDG